MKFFLDRNFYDKNRNEVYKKHYDGMKINDPDENYDNKLIDDFKIWENYDNWQSENDKKYLDNTWKTKI